MIRSLAVAVLLPAPAFAHPGHLAELAGHGHWIAAGALAAWSAGRKAKAAETADDADEAPQGAEEADA